MKIAICGDISVVDSEKLFAEKNVKELFNDVPKVFSDCDEVIFNLETAVTDCDTKIRKFGPNLKSPYGTIETIKMAGATTLALSNNHIFDFGKQGLKDTIREIEKNGLKYTGIGKNYQDSRKNLILTDGDKRVAIVNVCEHEYSYALEDRVGARPYDPYDTLEDVENAKKQADYVVVIYHGGKEQCRYPSPRLFKLCHSLVNHGADVVLCQHSHCIGCYEHYNNGHILFGQGNFHFVWSNAYKKDNPPFDPWKEGLIVKLNFTDKVDIEFVPVKIVGLGIATTKGTEKEQVLDALKERSKSLKNGTWQKHWEDFCKTITYCLNIAKDDKVDYLGHMLDCEAHYDVMKEIYKTWNHTNEK